jgi:hypothetical protein
MGQCYKSFFHFLHLLIRTIVTFQATSTITARLPATARSTRGGGKPARPAGFRCQCYENGFSSLRKAGAYLSGAPLKGRRLPALPANIRLALKSLPRTMTVAYYKSSYITDKKSFITLPQNTLLLILPIYNLQKSFITLPQNTL